MSVDQALVRRVQSAVGVALQQASRLSPAAEQAYAHSLVQTEIETIEAERLHQELQPLEPDVEQELVEAVMARLYGAGRLQQLLEDDEVENIDINGCDEVWVTYAGGKRVAHESVADSDEELIEQVQTLASYVGLSARPFDAANPTLDLRLPDGSRLAAVQQVTARPAVSIRRHRHPNPRLAELVANDTLDERLADFLSAAVRAKLNVMIAGGTDVGKTTLLRALVNEIDPGERLITVEKALELGLRKHPEQHPNVVEFEERLPNSEGQGAVSMAELVRRSLRMNPDRVIVGEVLGDEVVTMLNAMGQGNDGSLSTIHTRSGFDVFSRLATYAIQAAENLDPISSSLLIAGGLDVVVFLKKTGPGQRRVREVREVNGHDGQGRVLSSGLWEPGPDGAAVRQPVAVSEHRLEQLVEVGYVDPEWGETW